MHREGTDYAHRELALGQKILTLMYNLGAVLKHAKITPIIVSEGQVRSGKPVCMVKWEMIEL